MINLYFDLGSMPVLRTASRQQFTDASYAVEVFYRMVSRILHTTGAPTNHGGCEYWDLLLLPSAVAVDVMPHRYIPPNLAAHRIGNLGQVFPPCRDRTLYPDMRTYIERYTQSHPFTQWYRSVGL